jgi:hypothetical protein
MKNILIIFFIIIILIEKTIECDFTNVVQAEIEECSRFVNGTQICETKVGGSITLTQGSTFCSQIKYNGLVIGELQMKVLNIELIPNCAPIYWTFGYGAGQLRTPDLVFVFLANLGKAITICNDNTEWLENPYCKCIRNCNTRPEYNNVDRSCYGQIPYTTNQLNQFPFINGSRYIGNTGCNICKVDIEFGGITATNTYSQFYQLSLIPKLNEIFQVWECKNTGSYDVKVQIDFFDSSGTNNNVIPPSFDILHLNASNPNLQSFFNISFPTNFLSTGINNFPNGVNILVPPFGKKYSSNLCYFATTVKSPDGPIGTGIGETQAPSEEAITTQNFLQPMISSNPDFWENELKVKASKSILSFIQNGQCASMNGNGQLYNIKALSSAISNNLAFGNSSILFKLPTSLFQYNLQCYNNQTNPIFTNYQGSFQYQLTYRMPQGYKFVNQINQVCPLITDCSKIGGYKNSTRNSFIIIEAYSTCLSGMGTLSLIDTDANNLIISPNSISLDKFSQNYNLSFHINTGLTKVNITITLYGNYNTQSSCWVVYEPILPLPGDTTTNGGEKTPNPTNPCSGFTGCCNVNPKCLGNIGCCIFNPTETISTFLEILIIGVIVIVVIIIIIVIINAILPKSK